MRADSTLPAARLAEIRARHWGDGEAAKTIAALLAEVERLRASATASACVRLSSSAQHSQIHRPADNEVIERARLFIAGTDVGHIALQSVARALLAEHARAEAAVRERDAQKQRADDNAADCARLVSEKMDEYERAEAAERRATEAEAELQFCGL